LPDVPVVYQRNRAAASSKLAVAYLADERLEERQPPHTPRCRSPGAAEPGACSGDVKGVGAGLVPHRSLPAVAAFAPAVVRHDRQRIARNGRSGDRRWWLPCTSLSEGASMSHVVQYTVDDGAIVLFEVEPPEGFEQASAERVVGRVREAIGPAVEAAREVLERVKAHRPHEVEVKFGIKVSGTMNWMVAKAATEGNFEVTLKWQPGSERGAAVPS
jgi:hypothetical protein